jgi:PiT family inorganic phosphate transporter
MGSKITRLHPMQGVRAATLALLSAAARLGIPVPAAPTITVGGVGRRISAVPRGAAGNFVVAWVITLPSGDLIAAATRWAADFVG